MAGVLREDARELSAHETEIAAPMGWQKHIKWMR